MTQHPGIPLYELSSTIRPQDDLFRHVNETWLEATPIPADKATYGTFAILAEEAERNALLILEEATRGTEGTEARKLGDLYTSFMDEAAINRNGIQAIEPLLEEVESATQLQDFLALLGRTQREGLASAFHLFVDSDPGDPSRYLVFFEQGGLSLPNERYYREERFQAIHGELTAHIRRMLELAGRRNALESAQRIVALEDAIASHHWDNVACRDSVKTYNLTTFTDLSAIATKVSSACTLNTWASGLGVPTHALLELVLRQPSFLEGIASLFIEDNLQAWKDWLVWRIIHSSAPYLPAAFVEENFAFYGTMLTGAAQIRDRWKRGVGFVEGAMGEAIGRIYVDRHFDSNAKQEMDKLVANLLAAYRERITNLEWTTPSTRDRALDKLNKFCPKIGYPSTWKDYSDLSVNASNLWGNIRRVSEWHFARELNKIGHPVDRDEWFMTPQTVNAYYNPGFNEIVFPAAILQYPFFDPDRDPAANYGAIGAVIGHEIGHGFDDEGSRYDGDGRLQDWWTAEDREAFESRTRSLIAQYDALTPRQSPGHTVNGSLTIGENIGDLGGLGIAWVAYQLSLDGEEPEVIDGLTGAQRFFYSWAIGWRDKRRDEEMIRRLATDPHSPNEFRCNQVVRNIDAFHEAFHTSESDPMWLDSQERVRIW
jgi:putative endopeptidase